MSIEIHVSMEMELWAPIHAAVHAGIAEAGCTNMTYARNHLRPYPSTVGPSSQPLPLMSSTGDGISVLGARSGPTIVNNTMRGCARLLLLLPWPTSCLTVAAYLLPG